MSKILFKWSTEPTGRLLATDELIARGAEEDEDDKEEEDEKEEEEGDEDESDGYSE